MPLELNPFFSLQDGIDDAIFDECFFDELSLSLIAKSNDRIAVVGWVLSESKTLPLCGRPGLTSKATPKDIETAKVKYGDDNFVIAKEAQSSAGLGVVHKQTREQGETSNPSLKKKYIGHIGCAFYLGKILNWTPRSAFNRTVFKPDELAQGCFIFNPFLNSVLSTISHTFEEDILRIIPLPYFNRIMAAASKQLKIPCEYLLDNYEQQDVPTSYAQQKWEKIRKMEEKEKTEIISTILAINIYIASSLPKNKKLTNPHAKNRSGFESNLKFLLRLKNKYALHLTIDVDFVPDDFRAETKGATALIMAAGRGYIDTAELLLQNGANIHAKTIDGYTPILIAALNGNIQMIKLLNNKGASLEDKNRNNESIYDKLNIHIQSLADRNEFEKIETILNEANDFLSIEFILLSTNSIINPLPKNVKQSIETRIQKKFLESKIKDPETETFLFDRFQKRITNNKFERVRHTPPDLLNYFISKQVSTGFLKHKRWLDTLEKNKIDIAYWLALHGADEKALSQSFSNDKIMNNIYTCSSIFNLTPKIQNDSKDEIKNTRLAALDRMCSQAEKLSDEEFATRLNFFRILDDFIPKLMEIEECNGIKESYLNTYRDFATEKNDKEVVYNLIEKIKEIIKFLQSSNTTLSAKLLDKLNDATKNAKAWYKDLVPPPSPVTMSISSFLCE